MCGKARCGPGSLLCQGSAPGAQQVAGAPLSRLVSLSGFDNSLGSRGGPAAPGWQHPLRATPFHRILIMFETENQDGCEVGEATLLHTWEPEM